jgi:hypothetical protein
MGFFLPTKVRARRVGKYAHEKLTLTDPLWKAIEDPEERLEAIDEYEAEKEVLVNLVMVDEDAKKAGDLDHQTALEITEITATWESVREKLVLHGAAAEADQIYFIQRRKDKYDLVVGPSKARRTKIRMMEGMGMRSVKDGKGTVPPKTKEILYTRGAPKTQKRASSGKVPAPIPDTSEKPAKAVRRGREQEEDLGSPTKTPKRAEAEEYFDADSLDQHGSNIQD